MLHAFARRAAVQLAISAIIATAGCTVHNQEAPGVTGPSTFATSVTVNAIPDAISQDGGSQSSVKVLVIGRDGKGMAGVPLRLDMVVNGVSQDFGTLSARTIVTNADGVATVVYTAPVGPPNGVFGTCANLPGSCVMIVATPTGTNFQTAISEGVTIRLVPPGVILPPASTPTAAFTFSPQPATANLPLLFDASISQPGSGAGQITTYNWTFGDGSSATGKTPTHTYAAQSTYNVTLTVTNDRNLSASTTLPVNVVSGGLPTPVFTVSPAAPAVNDPVFFNASTSTTGAGHTITAFRWTFGDGTTGSGMIITHAYTAVGTYTVQLTVTDDAGLSATSAGTTVAVGNQSAAGTNFTFSPAAPAVGDSVIFDYRSSTLVNGQAIVALDWNFGDGTTPVHCPGNAACASDGITTHAFQRAGTFTVVLVTTDAAGRTGTKSTPVTVAAGGTGTTAPTATFTASPAAAAVNDPINFNAQASTAGAGHTIVSYAWTFGDGTTGTGVTVTHAFSTSGSYSVQLRVTDEVGQSTTSPATSITVGNPTAPSANFTFSPTSPGRNDLVVFDASSSSTAQGQTITFVDWNFGDGTPVIRCPGPSTDCQASNNRISSHTFATAQTFVVNLVVTDSANRTGSKNTSVSVALAQPTVLITTSPASPNPGNFVQFNSSGTTYFAGSGPASFAWTFGDGTTSTLANPTHSYAVVGSYGVGLSVTDSRGRTGTGTATVSVVAVTPPPPPAPPVAAFSFSPPNPGVGAGTNTVSFDGSTSTSPGGVAITNYRWNFGDGTIISGPPGNVAPGPAPSTFLAPRHTYLAGTYTVTLTVTNVNGSGSTTGTVTVVP